jgi:hypothetical protein
MLHVRLDFPPEGIRKIHNNGLGRAADNYPLERNLPGRVNLLVRKPGWNIKEIPFLNRCIKLPSLAPSDVRGAAEDVGDRVLLSMVMDSRMGSGFDEE